MISTRERSLTLTGGRKFGWLDFFRKKKKVSQNWDGGRKFDDEQRSSRSISMLMHAQQPQVCAQDPGVLIFADEKMRSTTCEGGGMGANLLPTVWAECPSSTPPTVGAPDAPDEQPPPHVPALQRAAI